MDKELGKIRKKFSSSSGVSGDRRGRRGRPSLCSMAGPCNSRNAGTWLWRARPGAAQLSGLRLTPLVTDRLRSAWPARLHRWAHKCSGLSLNTHSMGGTTRLRLFGGWTAPTHDHCTCTALQAACGRTRIRGSDWSYLTPQHALCSCACRLRQEEIRLEAAVYLHAGVSGDVRPQTGQRPDRRRQVSGSKDASRGEGGGGGGGGFASLTAVCNSPLLQIEAFCASCAPNRLDRHDPVVMSRCASLDVRGSPQPVQRLERAAKLASGSAAITQAQLISLCHAGMQKSRSDTWHVPSY